MNWICWISQGYTIAKKAVLEYLDTIKIPVAVQDKDVLDCVARTSLRTKLPEPLADQLTNIVTEAVLTVHKEDEPIDLHMVLKILV